MRFVFVSVVVLAGSPCCLAQENTPMKSSPVDAAIEDLNVDGRAIQRLWLENDKLLLSVSGPAVIDIYAKTTSKPIGRELFTGADDEPRRPDSSHLVPLTPQGETCGGGAWCCSTDAADRRKLLRPWGYNSFTSDRDKPGYGARTGFQVQRVRDGVQYADAVFGNIETPAGGIQGTLVFRLRGGENIVRMRLGAPGPYYWRGSDEAKEFHALRIGFALAKLCGKEQVARGDDYLAAYGEPDDGPAKKVGLAVIYDPAHCKGYTETSQDGGNRVLWFDYEPVKRYSIPMWLLAGWDGDGSATGSRQWQAHVKKLTKQFQEEQQDGR